MKIEPRAERYDRRAGFIGKPYHPLHLLNRAIIERDLSGGGFEKVAEIATVGARSRARSPRVPAIAFCQGTPLRSEIEARDASRLTEATDVAAEAIARRFGGGAVEGKIQAHVVTVDR